MPCGVHSKPLSKLFFGKKFFSGLPFIKSYYLILPRYQLIRAFSLFLQKALKPLTVLLLQEI